MPSPPRTITKQKPQTDRECRPTVREPLQVAEEPPAVVHPPPQTNAEQQPKTDTELPLTAPGSSQVSEKLPAMVSLEDLETDDVVIAYVIQLSTVKCLT